MLRRSVWVYLLLQVLLFLQWRSATGNSLLTIPNWKFAKKLLLNSIVGIPIAFGSVNSNALAADRTPSPYYFGVGCFWHVQHEFVEAERKLLQRSDSQITALAGYAGGKKVGAAGEVCYHNLQRLAEYGDLGHGEVVSVDINDDKYVDFFEQYLKLFSPVMDRPDVGDRGPEYRSLIGLPGGVNNPRFHEIKKIAEAKNLKLVEGKGDDADTLGKKMVWVMDSDAFPFHQAEVYHQFHDGFMPGEQYPQKYNDLKKEAIQRGLVTKTGCPDSFL